MKSRGYIEKYSIWNTDSCVGYTYTAYEVDDSEFMVEAMQRGPTYNMAI